MSDIVRYYDSAKNPEGAAFSFWPLRDIPEADWDDLEQWQKESIDASPMFRKTKPRAEAVPDDAPRPKRKTKADEDVAALFAPDVAPDEEAANG